MKMNFKLLTDLELNKPIDLNYKNKKVYQLYN